MGWVFVVVVVAVGIRKIISHNLVTDLIDHLIMSI